jgi:tetratricopeptide (TPR) repeat protein
MTARCSRATPRPHPCRARHSIRKRKPPTTPGKPDAPSSQTATRDPFAPSAETARLRQARLLEQQGDIEDAFDAYDKFLARYPGSKDYMDALNRQASMAQGAAEGDVKSSFLGLKTKLSLEKTVAMLEKVSSRAPPRRRSSPSANSIRRSATSRRKPSPRSANSSPTSPTAPRLPKRSSAWV